MILIHKNVDCISISLHNAALMFHHALTKSVQVFVLFYAHWLDDIEINFAAHRRNIMQILRNLKKFGKRNSLFVSPIYKTDICGISSNYH